MRPLAARITQAPKCRLATPAKKTFFRRSAWVRMKIKEDYSHGRVLKLRAVYVEISGKVKIKQHAPAAALLVKLLQNINVHHCHQRHRRLPSLLVNNDP